MTQSPFSLDPDIFYLNHAAIAPLPSVSAQAIRDFATECEHRGSKHYERWASVEKALRRRLASLIGAGSADDIGLLKSTSEGLSVVAHGFPWAEGDNVVISDQEFPSNRIVWESLRPLGVEVRPVCLTGAESPEQALIQAMDSRTRLLAISSIQFARGLRVDLVQLGSACRERGVAFCVDAIQSVGAVQIDVQAAQIDFLAADAHKWMLGPEGIALFYCSAPWRERLALHQFGWHMRKNMGDFDSLDWQPADSARRFECGSPNTLGIHALSASLALLQEVGMAQVEAQVLQRTRHLQALTDTRADLEVLTDLTDRRYGGIFTFRSLTLPTETVMQHLRAAGVICAARGGGIRFSPHFYTPLEQLDQALDCIPRGTN